MSTYYDFMVEAKYKDKWYNIDLHTKDFDGKLRHQYLATFSRSFVGQLESLIDGAWRIGFDDLAESTQNLLLSLSIGTPRSPTAIPFIFLGIWPYGVETKHSSH